MIAEEHLLWVELIIVVTKANCNPGYACELLILCKLISNVDIIFHLCMFTLSPITKLI